MKKIYLHLEENQLNSKTQQRERKEKESSKEKEKKEKYKHTELASNRQNQENTEEYTQHKSKFVEKNLPSVCVADFLDREQSSRCVEQSSTQERALSALSMATLKNNNNFTNTLQSNTSTDIVFSPPSLQEVSAFFKKRMIDNPEISAKFINYYEATGWKIGNNKILKWEPVAERWAKREKEFCNAKTANSNIKYQQMSYEQREKLSKEATRLAIKDFYREINHPDEI